MVQKASGHVFISYSRNDDAVMQRVVKYLRKQGINVWVDNEKLDPGTPMWRKEVERAIINSKAVVVLLSPDSNKSIWVGREISFSETHNKRIFPILIAGDEKNAIPIGLTNHQRIDIRQNEKAGLSILNTALSTYLKFLEDKEKRAREKVVESDLESTEKDKPEPVEKPPDDPTRKQPTWIKYAIIGLGLTFLTVFGGWGISKITTNKPTPTVTATQPEQPDEPIEPGSTPDNSEPSGKIVYTCEVHQDEASGQLCIMDADGSNTYQITDNAFMNIYPSLAPDGQSIVFSSNQDSASFEIYETDLQGNITRLTYGIGDLYAPEISPNGQEIVFTNNYDNYSKIWIMERDGGEPHKIYSQPGVDALDPLWADEETILFALGTGNDKQLYIVDKEGKEARQVSSAFTTRGRSDLSPNGEYIVSYSGEAWEREVYIMYPDGTGLRQLSPPGGNSQGPSFSPDGEWVAFTAYYETIEEKDPQGCDIYIIRTEGTDLRKLTDNDYCDYQPRWGN